MARKTRSLFTDRRSSWFGRDERLAYGKPLVALGVPRGGAFGAVLFGISLWLGGCCSAPPSQFPDARTAIAKRRETQACSRGLSGEATLDYIGDGGRVRGNVLYLASAPERIRFDVFSPFGVTLSTVTSDGENFALFDLRQKTFLYGPAQACNVARFTQVPVPPYALVQLLRGEAPVLVHQPEQATLAWECGLFGSGRYVLGIESKHGASEEIEFVPHPDDRQKHFSQQRLRVLSVRVEQQGIELYRAELKDHEARSTAKPHRDPDGIAPTLMPSGPECRAEVPGRMRIEVPNSDQDLVLINKELKHNPPLSGAEFRQTPPAGVVTRYVTCE